MTKPWWQSKTLWLNLIVATLYLAEENIDALHGILPDGLQKSLVFGLPILNMWLRAVTKHGLSFKPQMPVGEQDA